MRWPAGSASGSVTRARRRRPPSPHPRRNASAIAQDHHGRAPPAAPATNDATIASTGSRRQATPRWLESGHRRCRRRERPARRQPPTTTATATTPSHVGVPPRERPARPHRARSTSASASAPTAIDRHSTDVRPPAPAAGGPAAGRGRAARPGPGRRAGSPPRAGPAARSRSSRTRSLRYTETSAASRVTPTTRKNAAARSAAPAETRASRNAYDALPHGGPSSGFAVVSHARDHNDQSIRSWRAPPRRRDGAEHPSGCGQVRLRAAARCAARSAGAHAPRPAGCTSRSGPAPR
jgi:hypothetical protein